MSKDIKPGDLFLDDYGFYGIALEAHADFIGWWEVVLFARDETEKHFLKISMHAKRMEIMEI